MVFWNRNATRADKMDKLAELLMDETKSMTGLRKKVDKLVEKVDALEKKVKESNSA